MSQFYFAWVAASETTFTDAHKRSDEDIFDFKLSQSEGDFASLEITLVNPRIGLLAPGRDIWAWFAMEHPTAGTVPLFFGRLVALPTDLDEATVKLTFIARPSDFESQKATLAAAMKVRPYWDAIWFSPDTVDDPDNVLESRPELWNIDPVTHVVTSSNIIEGEDGNIDLDEDGVFYDSVRVSYAAPPLRAVQMVATVSWQQIAKGSVDISDKIIRAFGGSVRSFTGEGLQKDWPAPGRSIGGGWTVESSRCQPFAYVAPTVVFEPGWAKGPQNRGTGTPFEDFTFDALFQPHGGLRFVNWYFDTSLVLSYDVSRQRKESLSFQLEADVQSIVTDPAGQDVLLLNMNSSEITQAVDPGGVVPMGDQSARAYFTTDRGEQSVEYLIAVARARMLARARCVEVSLEMPFNDGIAAVPSCRKNVVFSDHRLPGGIATGKIIEYTISLNGDTGDTKCEITFGSTAGHGNGVVAVAGSPDYVEDDYVEAAWQLHSGGFVLPDLGDVLYAPINGTLPDDDGINFHALGPEQVVESLTVANAADVQGAAMPFHSDGTTLQPLGTWSQFYLTNMAGHPSGSFRPDYDPASAIAALNLLKTTVTMQLRSLQGGPFETDYALDVSQLMVPKLIDLEAVSSP